MCVWGNKSVKILFYQCKYLEGVLVFTIISWGEMTYIVFNDSPGGSLPLTYVQGLILFLLVILVGA